MGSIRHRATATGATHRSRRRRGAAVVAAVLAGSLLLGCSRQEPEVTLEEQVPAEMRTGDDGGGEAEGDAGGESPDGEALQFVAVDIDYADAPAEAVGGSTTIELVNDGNIVHDVSFDELGGRTVVVANGGETASGEVDLEPGTYTYFCSVPGHRSAGMEGTLTVTEP